MSRRPFRNLLLLMFINAVTTFAQPSLGKTKEVFRYGTCSTTVLAPFGAAFIIDSRLTETDSEGNVQKQYEGCKVRLARPTILLAGVGLEDQVDAEHGHHWNSLVEADRALASLPANPSASELNSWSWAWGNTLLRHYQSLKPPSKPQVVAELLLVTKIAGKPYYHRTDVDWDGLRLRVSVEGQTLDQSGPYLLYSGSCRQFVTHSSFQGGSMEAGKYVTPREKQAMNIIGSRVKKEGTSTDDLIYAAQNLEEWLVRVDERLEGEHATIAPPFATADWPEASDGWRVHFNQACNLDQSHR